MYRLRLWSSRNAAWLEKLYHCLESILHHCHPLFKRIGYRRLEKLIFPVEKVIKSVLFDSQSCGQCMLGRTGMSCPMNCPKSLRNGPCGGVRQNGHCEVKQDMPCVWVVAWQGSESIKDGVKKIQLPGEAVDFRLRGTSAWLREVRRHHQ